MASWARPGVKCVCVDASHVFGALKSIVEGNVYTIAEVRNSHGTNRFGRSGTTLCFRLVGVKKTEGFDDFYDAERFRPLVTKTQEEDVAMFKRIADDVPTVEPIT